MRLKIWNSALEEEIHREGRIVEVRWSQKNKRFISDIPIPVLLRTCHDSRIEARNALKLLTIAVEVSDPDDQALELRRLGFAMPDENKPPSVALFRTYFDFDLDTLFLSQHHFDTGDPRGQQSTKLNELLKALNSQCLVAGKIRYFAFSGEFFDVEESGARMFNTKALEKVTFVFDDRCCFRACCRSGVRHNKLIKFEDMKFPRVPALQNQHTTNNVFANIGIHPPQQNIFGHLNAGPGIQGTQHTAIHPHQALGTPQFNGGFNASLSPLFRLSEADKHALKIQAIWHSRDDDLVTYLEDNVADRTEDTQGQAREELDDLETCAVTAVREEPPKVIKETIDGVAVASKPAKRSFFEGYEVTVNGRPVRG
jgi:hypothetical protein